jgi:flagellar protein FliS
MANTESNPLKQIVLLYDGAIKFLNLTADDIEKKDFIAKAEHSNRALDIIGYLQSILDFNKGGEVAASLDNLYRSITVLILRASAELDAGLMRRAAGLLAPVRDAWETNSRQIPGSFENAPPAFKKKMIEQEITKNSDSLIDLLTAQCADLEKLLGLAREETLAAEQGNFLGILDIVSEREQIGHRLETFQQQIAELRSSLGETAESVRRSKIAAQMVMMADQTLAQDHRTKLLLTAARENSRDDLQDLGKVSRGTIAYLRSETKGLTFDRNL